MTDNLKNDRRTFLQQAGTGAAACLTGLALGSAPRIAVGSQPVGTSAQRPLRLAMASYSLRKFDLQQTIQMTVDLGLEAICLKSFHLPLELSNEQVAAEAAKVRDAGLTLYGGGVITMKNAEQVDRAFEYAKAAGMTKIIGVPAPELLGMVNDKVQQYDIAVCIHNHGPGDNLYPTPDVAYDKIKHLDRRIGLCHDVGHTVRVGKDPAKLTEQCADRLLDVHIKDVTEDTKKGHSIACGRGVIDLPGLLRTFLKIDYQGFLAFEYEEEPDSPLAGLAESVGYINGVLDTLK